MAAGFRDLLAWVFHWWSSPKVVASRTLYIVTDATHAMDITQGTTKAMFIASGTSSAMAIETDTSGGI